MPGPTQKHNFIVFSDVHLGADLVHHVRPWTLSRLKEAARIDRELASMLDWYRAHADPAHPWRLVIAGDLVDFIGISIAPQTDGDCASELNDEEREFGLGSTEPHAVEKMRAVAKRHPLVFEKLAAFVADGHSLALIRGNHDVDFHWPLARKAFIEALEAHRPELGDDEARAAFEARVEFYPWFLYVEGLLYIEHGHQFDAMCSYHHQLAPVSPLDPRRICWSFSDLLLRQVVRPTPELGSDGHDLRGMLYYVRLGLSLGRAGALRLFKRYMRATVTALRRWRAHLSDAAKRVHEDNEACLHVLASGMRIGIEKLRALAALWPRPVTRSGLPVLRSMFLDRVLLVGGVSLAIALNAALIPMLFWIPLSIALVLCGVFAWRWSSRARARDVDPKVQMLLAASNIAKLLPSRYVVMGHTHEPVAKRIDDTATYVNLGNWGVDDLDAQPQEPPRTHLVLRWVGEVAEASFLRWDSTEGPVLALELPASPAPAPAARTATPEQAPIEPLKTNMIQAT